MELLRNRTFWNGWRCLLLFWIVLCLVACTSERSKVEVALTSMQACSIVLPFDRMYCRIGGKDTIISDEMEANLKMIVYVDSSECTPCAIDQLQRWNTFIEASKKYRGKMKYVFIVAPKREQYEDACLSIEYSNLKSPIYVDTSFVFRHINRNIPNSKRFHTFCLIKTIRL